MTDGPVLFLVEDDVIIRYVLSASLTDAGFTIESASRGVEAMAQISKNAMRFRAVITDIRLGKGPDGWDIAQSARKFVPTMPVIYMTGDSGHDWASKGVPNSVILVKPFVPAQMVTAVASLLSGVDRH